MNLVNLPLAKAQNDLIDDSEVLAIVVGESVLCNNHWWPIYRSGARHA